MEEHELEILDQECVAEAGRELRAATEALAYFYAVELSRLGWRSGVSCSRPVVEGAGRHLAAVRLRHLADDIDEPAWPDSQWRMNEK